MGRGRCHVSATGDARALAEKLVPVIRREETQLLKKK